MTEVKDSIINLSMQKKLEIEPVSGKSLYINTSSVAFLDIQKDEDSYITSVSLEDKFEIKIGDKFKIRLGLVDSVYEVKFIAVQEGDKSIVLFSSFPTRTTTFLLPLLNKSKVQLRYDSYFVNAFIDNSSQYISLLYRFTGTEIYKKWEQTTMNDPLCIGHKDYDPYHVIYIFRIPKEFQADVEAFKEGKYSLFSKALRQRILKFYGGEDEAATMKIIKQDKGLRKQLSEHFGYDLPEDAELASIPDLKVETYNI
jgi:hypothetical protein